MAFVSVTRLRVRSWRFLPMFLIRSFRAAQQAKSAEGNLAVALLRQPQNTYWTRTVWTSEAAMKAFMLAGAHRGAMQAAELVRRGGAGALDSGFTAAARLARIARQNADA